MEFKVLKLGKYWLTVENLKMLKSLLEVQETTDKEPMGDYIVSDGYNEYYYRVNENYNIIIEKIEN